MKKQTKIIIGVVALIAVITVLLGIYAATRPDTTAGAKELTIVVVHGDESQKTFGNPHGCGISGSGTDRE